MYIEELLYTKSQCLLRINRIWDLKGVKDLKLDCDKEYVKPIKPIWPIDPVPLPFPRPIPIDPWPRPGPILFESAPAVSQLRIADTNV